MSIADSVLMAFNSELMTLQVMILLRSLLPTVTERLACVFQPPRGLSIVRLWTLLKVTLSTTHWIVAGGFELEVTHSYVNFSPALASRGPCSSTDAGATAVVKKATFEKSQLFSHFMVNLEKGNICPSFFRLQCPYKWGHLTEKRFAKGYKAIK